MTKRDEYLANIRKQLSVFEVNVRLNNIVNRQGINITAEDVMGGLLNLLYQWNLRNTNGPKKSERAIDLADWQKGIVVQVSSDTRSQKIKWTLEQLRDPQFADRKIKKLVMMLLRPKKKYKTAFVHDGFELEILDVNDIIAAVEHESTAGLRRISTYLDETLGYQTDNEVPKPAPVSKPVHMLPPVPGASDSFLAGSRNQELKTLKNALAEGSPVFIWGLGGMGKTQTAIQLAKRCKPRRGAYFLRYTIPDRPDREAMFETIRGAQFSRFCLDADGETDPEALMQMEYRQKLEILWQEYEDTLLIIDNFDWPGKTMDELKAERAYQDIAALANRGIQVVFTTRYPANPAWEIRPLSEPQLLELMRKSCADYEDAQLKPLIRAVGSHTLMVDLMAKTLAESWRSITPEQILKALEKATLNIADFPEVTSDKDGKFPQTQIYKHLQALFNLSDLTPEAKKVMSVATLIADEGLDDMLFRESLPVEEQKELQRLCKRGWLRREDDVVTIHPVVLQVCRSELPLEDADMQTFLDGLWAAYEQKQPSGTAAMRRVGQCTARAISKLRDRDVAVQYGNKVLPIFQKVLQQNCVGNVSYFTWMGKCYVFVPVTEPTPWHKYKTLQNVEPIQPNRMKKFAKGKRRRIT